MVRTALTPLPGFPDKPDCDICLRDNLVVNGQAFQRHMGDQRIDTHNCEIQHNAAGCEVR